LEHRSSPGTGGKAGIQVGAQIIAWDNQPISDAISEVVPYFGPYSTEHTKRLSQATFLTRLPPGTRIDVSYQNPGDSQPQQVKLEAEVEYTSLFMTLPGLNEDELALPIQGEVLDKSQVGYIRINTFNDDYHLMAQLWESKIQALIDNEIPGLIIDLRTNGGGSSGLAYDFAGYFFDEEITLYNSAYYNEQSGQFEFTDYPARIKPGPLLYEGPIVVLVSPDCVSACEGFTYALTQQNRSIVIGHYPTAGAFGEVGRGQYELPDDLSMQFPTGRPETPDGVLLIEGSGVIPDIIVPVTLESALGQVDAVLEAAQQALLDLVK
jgi:carboxyl-terminal processing protease